MNRWIVVFMISFVWCVGSVSARPLLTAPEAFDVSSPTHALRVQCGTPPEFAMGLPGPVPAHSKRPSPVTAPARSSVTAVPEPSALVLFGLGLLGVIGLTRRRRGHQRYSHG